MGVIENYNFGDLFRHTGGEHISPDSLPAPLEPREDATTPITEEKRLSGPPVSENRSTETRAPLGYSLESEVSRTARESSPSLSSDVSVVRRVRSDSPARIEIPYPGRGTAAEQMVRHGLDPDFQYWEFGDGTLRMARCPPGEDPFSRIVTGAPPKIWWEKEDSH